MDQALVAILRDDATIGALIEGRIYPGQVPATVPLPAVSYLQTGYNQPRTLGGKTHARHSFQLRALADDKTSAAQLARALLDALDDYRGQAAGMTVADITVTNQYDEPQWDPHHWAVITTITTLS